MPHSPYTQTVVPPLSDQLLDEYRQELQESRERLENCVYDQDAHQELLDIAENLVEHVDFLDAKLHIKVCTYLIDMVV